MVKGICRSPSAEAVFKAKAAALNLSINIDSAGTIATHQGESPDRRSQQAGEQRGYSFEGIYSRKITLQDFEKYDLILAMDNDNLANLQAMSPEQYQDKIKLFLEYGQNYKETEVPDPYYGGEQGFAFVLDLIEDASEGLIKQLSC